MRGFVALVWHEISERRALLAAAVVASLLPVLAPLLPATGGNPAADTRETVMWVMVGLLVPIFALLLGVSFVGRDLSEGRLGFYFAQPLSGPTIWFGKLTAVVLLVWAAQALIMLPTVVLSADPARLLLLSGFVDWHNRLPFLDGLMAPAFWLAPLAIVLVAHAVGVAWRGRSAWLVADLVALVVVAAGAWWALRPFLPMLDAEAAPWWATRYWWGLRVLLSSDAPMTAMAGLLWLVVAALVALVVAGAVQLTAGRVDLRRAHRSLSVALWAVLAVAVAALVGWSGWVRSATLADLLRADFVMVGAGDWIVVDGPLRGRLDYSRRFFVNAVDGRSMRIGSGSWESAHVSSFAFSGDGRHAVWSELEVDGGESLMVIDLSDPEPEPRAVGVDLGDDRSEIVISHEGGRVAILEGRIIAVYDVGSGDQLAAVAVTGEFNPGSCWFENADTVAIYSSTEHVWQGREIEPRYRWTIFRFDIPSKTLTRGEVEKYPKPKSTEAVDTQAPQRLQVVKGNSGNKLVLVDVDSGDQVADLGAVDYDYWGSRDLGNGGFVIIRRIGGEFVIDTFDPDGIRLHRIELGKDKRALLSGEVAPGLFMVGSRDWYADAQKYRDLRTDVFSSENGEHLETLDGFYALACDWRELWGLRVIAGPGAWQPGSGSSRLLLGDDRSLHLWDPSTGTTRQLIPVDG